MEYDGLGFRDTSLVRLFPTTRARARAEVIDGPHGIFSGYSSEPFQVQHIGRGAGISQVKDERTAVALGATDPDIMHIDAVVSVNDSGSPVFTANGQAIGWLVSASTNSLVDVGKAGPGVGAGLEVMRIGPPLVRAGKALHTTFTLMNA